MYSILNKTWNEVLSSELDFKCNSMKRIIEMEGKDMADSYSNESVILIFYNLYTGEPMMLAEKVPNHPDSITIDPTMIDCGHFNVNVEEVEEDVDCKEIILVRKDIIKALHDEESDA